MFHGYASTEAVLDIDSNFDNYYSSYSLAVITKKQAQEYIPKDRFVMKLLFVTKTYCQHSRKFFLSKTMCYD